MTDAEHLIRTVSRRHEILQSLLDGPKERRVLVDDLPNSKSTVYKGVSQLMDLGLLVKTSEGLKPTLYGVLALERYGEMARTARLGQVLADLPPGSIDPVALVGAETVVPDRRSVERHLDRVERVLRHSETLHGYSPAVSPRTVEVFHERTVDDGLEAEVVVTSDIVDYLRTQHSRVFRDILSADSVSLYRTDQEPPFTLLYSSSPAGREVCIDLGRDGLATGVIVNDTAESVRWARDSYVDLKKTAEPITDSDSG